MREKLLIVEDNVINRTILCKMLMDEYEIITASNGREAMQLIRKEYQAINAIILDLLMPEMDGKELLTILSKDEKMSNIPILIATGEHNEAVERECLELGAWDFVTKPYDATVIRLRLRNIIGRSQLSLIHQIQNLAERDTLTGLYNRQFFMNQTQNMIRDSLEENFVLIRMDVDQFRLYNASFGSEAGDLLLKNIAVEIQRTLSKHQVKTATYGRIESDVFCVCIPYHREKLEGVLETAEREIQRFCRNYRLKVSFGLYVIEDRTLEMEQIYAGAVEAARKCKYNLNKIYAYYGEEMSLQAKRAQMLTNAMERAIQEQQFQVYLQPKYVIETESPCGAEALVRWQHPEWGMVSPGEFIPIFEQNGLIVQLDYYMWEHVCILLQKWKEQGFPLFPVSVNISRVSMYNPKIVDQLAELTEKYMVPKHLLNLEITESAYMSNPDLMKHIIEQLREKGFIILMDDFGSGYSSLNTLKDIEVDILKIDMKFLPTGHNNAKSEKILASIARMAGWLGMPVIVEGVETKEQRDFLESIGCAYIQGYYYAKPMPVKEYESMLLKQKNTTEEKMEARSTILNEFDELWSSDSKTGMILKSVPIPFIIFEYSNSEVSILRENRSYSEEFGIKPLVQYIFHQENYKFLAAIDEAVLSQKNSHCECLFVMNDGSYKWYQIRFQYMGSMNKSSVLSATFTDVTSEKTLERELHTVFNVLKQKPQQKGTLLIVDDIEMIREALRALFEDEYDILCAADGQEGLEILQTQGEHVAAILLDMIMPRMNGQEFLSYKNKMPEAADIPVIVISADDNADTQINMLENGVNDYVTKPFVPAVVKQRLHNVIEYSSRFQNLIREYHAANTMPEKDKKNLSLKGYTAKEVRETIGFMSKIFDVVRLVDPRDTTVVTIENDGKMNRSPYTCFQIWGRNGRCENCSSICAMNNQCALNKFEMLKNDIFYVVSQPVDIYLSDSESESLVLEVASCISDVSKKIEREEALSIYHVLQNSYDMIYTDPLTTAYNRRYLDEMLFLHHGQKSVARKVALIMLDLNKFKQINDLFGHQAGDTVLKEVTEALKKAVRECDSIIRYGGDEFVVILTNIDEGEVEPAIGRLRDAIAKVHYGPQNTLMVEADFGYSYTDSYQRNIGILAQMVKEADQKMYEHKRAR